MSYIRPEALVETQWVADNLGLPGITLIDASFHLPTAQRDPKAEFSEAHIPGAVFFDINAIADQKTDLPHMLPDADQFGADVGALGISNDDHVICYDANGGAMAAMRAFWTFKVFGHSNVSLLNGGLPQWRAENRATDSGVDTPQPTNYTAADFQTGQVTNADYVLQNIQRATAQFVDARSAGRFHATEPEPRDGMRGGHVPGSINLPFQNLLHMDRHMRLRSADDLVAVIQEAGIDPAAPIISSCGSGVTAAVLSFALHLLGHDTVAIYDGSWTDWGGRADTPIET
mgnify:CR=1 FL=1